MKSLSFILLLLLFLGCNPQENNFEQEVDTSRLLPIESFVYTTTSLDISTVSENSRASFWKPDGSMIFVTGRDTENVAAYSVADPWNLSTTDFSATFSLPDNFGENTGLSVAHGLYLKYDGSRMWIFNRTEIWAFDLTEPWDITSAEVAHTQDLSAFVQRGHDIDFHPSGSILYIDDRNAQAVHQVRLNEPWDVTTLEWEYTLDISDLEQAVRGIEFIKDGSIMLLLDTGRKEVMQYLLEEPWDIKTAQYINSLDVSRESADPRGLSISQDLTKIYITARDKRTIYQYELIMN